MPYNRAHSRQVILVNTIRKDPRNDLVTKSARIAEKDPGLDGGSGEYGADHDYLIAA